MIKSLNQVNQGYCTSTWGGGSRIDMAIGIKTIDIINKEKILEKVNKSGNFLKKRLNELKNSSDLIMDVRGLGLMLGVEFHKKVIRNKVINRLFTNKLLVLPAGVKTIRILPPLVITDEEISKGLDIFEKVLKEINN